MRDDLNILFSREMDRRGFLKVVAAGLLAVIGITSVIQALTRFQTGSIVAADSPLTTYGHTSAPRGKL